MGRRGYGNLGNLHIHSQHTCSCLGDFMFVMGVPSYYAPPTDTETLDDDDEISPDLWQEACWIVIRLINVV